MTHSYFPTDLDCKEGCKLAFDNAMHHFEIANISRDISLGIANSHLILASEEAIKSLYLFQVSRNTELFNIETFSSYLQSHKFKHKENIKHSKFMKLLDLLGEDIEGVMDYLETISGEAMTEDDKKKLQEEWWEKLKTWYKGVPARIDERMKSNYSWWNEANNRKNLGFYVDFNSPTNKWIGPFNVTSEQFSKSLEIVSELIENINESINTDTITE